MNFAKHSSRQPARYLFSALLASAMLLLATSGFCENKHILVDSDSLSLREKASHDAKKLDTLITFEPVTVLERSKGWVKVRTEDKQTGWVVDEYQGKETLSKVGFVNVKNNFVNVRQGPGTEYTKLMRFYKNYPLQVLDVASNGWLKVEDFEGDKGWVHPNFVQTSPIFVISKLDKCNVRAGIGTDEELRFSVPKAYLFQVLKEKDGWLNVKAEDGDTGWMSAKIVFGYRDKD